MRIEVTATGRLKKYIPEKCFIEVDVGSTLQELKTACGMAPGTGAGYVVNGKIAHGDYLLEDGDQVNFIMIVGAG